MPPSLWADLGTPVHYVDLGGPADGPLLVCVHGLGGSYLNWAALGTRLTGVCRVVAVDLLGFGHSQARGHPTSVAANREMLHRFLTEVVGEPAVLVGNSMGGLVCGLQAAAAPETARALALVDPVLPLPRCARPHPLVVAGFTAYSHPRLGRAVLKGRRRGRTPEQLAMDVLRLCCVDPDRVARDLLAQHVDLIRLRTEYPDIDGQFLDAAASVVAVVRRPEAYVRALRSVRVPVLLLHGERDRLVPVEAARAAAAANPGWDYAEVPDVGHAPQLEAPDRVAGQLLGWLSRVEAPALSGPAKA